VFSTEATRESGERAHEREAAGAFRREKRDVLTDDTAERMSMRRVV
jgi:hypothetical protein